MIAVDAMGGDRAPEVVVHGALRAVRRGVSVILFGDEHRLVTLLTAANKSWRTLPISVVHCTETIHMTDEPGRGVLKKEDSSLVRALQAVQRGTAKAVVSAGNSGAVLFGATLILGKIPGILRPAIGGSVPTRDGTLFCIDLGANVDCKPEYLLQFALMGHVYVNMVNGVREPRIGLLSNGEEPYKGSALVKKAFQLLKDSSFNFVGNIEPTDALEGGVDVLVCDGFTGNIFLKSVEGTARVMSQWMAAQMQASWFGKLLFWWRKRLFGSLKEKAHYAKTGGALLLGVPHPVVIAHGASDAQAIENAIMCAHEALEKNFIQRFGIHVTHVMDSMTPAAELAEQMAREPFQVPHLQASQDQSPGNHVPASGKQ